MRERLDKGFEELAQPPEGDHARSVPMREVGQGFWNFPCV